MTTCTYAFKDADGKQVVITGQAAFKAYLATGGLDHLLPGALPAAAASLSKQRIVGESNRQYTPEQLAMIEGVKKEWKSSV